MSRSFRCCSFFLLAVLGFSGCVANQYEIELTPQGEKIKRELSVKRGAQDNLQAFPEEELQKIAVAYKAEVPKKLDQAHQFAGVFSEEMPRDVGGKGSYIHWETSLGTASAYVERFRGNDDLLAGVERRLKACDRLADHLIGWMESELKNEPGFPALRKFLDNELRRDLKNLSLHFWTFGNASIIQSSQAQQVQLQQEFLIRIGQFFIERSYFSPDQLPRLSRGYWEAHHNNNPRPLLDFVTRFVASKMNLQQDQPIPKSLKFLSNLPDLEASINKYFQETEEYQTMLKDWELERAENPEQKRPDPADVLAEAFVRALNLWTFLRIAPDRLMVKLNVTAEPVSTNGEWDADAKQIRWSRPLPEADSEAAEFPTLCYAIWSQPDTAAQTRIFGRVVLEGEALANYGLWVRGLSDREKQEWDTFLASLKQGKDLAGRLKTFRFSQEPAAPKDGQPAGLAAEVCQMLLQALGEKTE